jgi:hypothetical protein
VTPGEIQNGELLSELRRIAESDKPVDDATFRRLMLVAMLQFHNRLAGLERKASRDWAPLVMAGIVAVLTVAAAWAAP